MGPAHQLIMSKDQDAPLQARNCDSSINMKQPSAPITASTKSNENKILFHVKRSCMPHILKNLYDSLYQNIRFRCYILRRKSTWASFKDSVHTTWETYSISVTQTNQSVLYREKKIADLRSIQNTEMHTIGRTLGF